jgi:hypothetical protein
VRWLLAALALVLAVRGGAGYAHACEALLKRDEW